MRFMFLLEDGRLIGQSEGNHSHLIGWTKEDGYDLRKIEERLCVEHKALRLCFQPFWLKDDGTRGDFWSVYVEVGTILPNEAQWATLSALYLLNGHRNTVVAWDVYLAEEKRWMRVSEGTLAELRAVFNPKPKAIAESKPTRKRSTKKKGERP
jgi:hypothetical protein